MWFHQADAPPSKVWNLLPMEAREQIVVRVVDAAVLDARRTNRSHLFYAGAWAVIAVGIGALGTSIALVASTIAGGAAVGVHLSMFFRPTIGVETYFYCGRGIGVGSSREALRHFQYRNRSRDNWIPRIDQMLVREVTSCAMAGLDVKRISAQILGHEEAEAYGLRSIVEESCGLGAYEIARSLARHERFRDSGLEDVLSVVRRLGERQEEAHEHR